MWATLGLQLSQLFWRAYLKVGIPKIPKKKEKKKDWKLLCEAIDKSWDCGKNVIFTT